MYTSIFLDDVCEHLDALIDDSSIKTTLYTFLIKRAEGPYHNLTFVAN